MKSSTRCCQNMRSWVSSTAIRWPNPTPLTCGKRSSAISPTARRSCSTSSSVGRSKMAAHVGSGRAFCRMGSKGKGQNTSSARLERFLQKCGQDNWIVANCTHPPTTSTSCAARSTATFRKPLILMTPKSLLRHKLAVSNAEDFTTGSQLPPAAVGRRAEGQLRHQTGHATRK